jgi:hypothetical protein
MLINSVGATEISPQVVERRKFPRYRYSAPLNIRTGDLPEIPAMSLEISESGASLMTGAALKVGEIVELEPIGGDVANAIVRRNLGKLYGVEFVGLNSSQVLEIRMMCQMLPTYRSTISGLWPQ